MNDAAKALAQYIDDGTSLDFWCGKVDGLFFGEELGQCVVRKVSDTELAFLKPNGKIVTFRSPEGFIVEPCIGSHVAAAFQIHIRTPNLTDWVNLKPLFN